LYLCIVVGINIVKKQHKTVITPTDWFRYFHNFISHFTYLKYVLYIPEDGHAVDPTMQIILCIKQIQ